MQVKLAFAVATSVDSEILIVDEVLAVGDLAFQRKCFDRLEELINAENRTVLVVSHNLRQIERLCERVLLLDHGHIIADGEPKSVCNRMYEEMDAKIAAQTEHGSSSRGGGAISDGRIELLDIVLIDEHGDEVRTLRMGASATLHVRYRSHQAVESPIFGVGVHTGDFIYLTTEQSHGRLEIGTLEPGVHLLSFRMKTIPLLPGVYAIRLGIADGTSGAAVFYKDNALHFQVTATGISRAWNTTSDEGFFSLDADWALTRNELASLDAAINE
jgi:hypothetical protein